MYPGRACGAPIRRPPCHADIRLAGRPDIRRFESAQGAGEHSRATEFAQARGMYVNPQRHRSIERSPIQGAKPAERHTVAENPVRWSHQLFPCGAPPKGIRPGSRLCLPDQARGRDRQSQGLGFRDRPQRIRFNIPPAHNLPGRKRTEADNPEAAVRRGSRSPLRCVPAAIGAPLECRWQMPSLTVAVWRRMRRSCRRSRHSWPRTHRSPPPGRCALPRRAAARSMSAG